MTAQTLRKWLRLRAVFEEQAEAVRGHRHLAGQLRQRCDGLEERNRTLEAQNAQFRHMLAGGRGLRPTSPRVAPVTVGAETWRYVQGGYRDSPDPTTSPSSASEPA